VLYKKGLITNEEIRESIREEHRLLKELGAMKEDPDEEIVEAIAESMLQWVRGDVEALKKGIKDYEKKLQEAMEKQAQKPKIDVASPAVLQQLNRMGGGKQGGGKIIL
jgi:molecular chaperone DnaK (HSP70)